MRSEADAFLSKQTSNFVTIIAKKRVIVFHDHVEVILKVSTMPEKDDGLIIRSEKRVKEIKKKFRETSFHRHKKQP
jgi:hypothetical protein